MTSRHQKVTQSMGNLGANLTAFQQSCNQTTQSRPELKENSSKKSLEILINNDAAVLRINNASFIQIQSGSRKNASAGTMMREVHHGV